ncbi:MAG: maleylacetoacetate isomerase [Proteobacteria bacterium]|nr:maleylacetoacetate isomerase [Pseudomonadota bacterium]
MQLYGFFRSSASYRARIALNVKGLGYEGVEIDLRAGASQQRTPQFLELNPEGLVPVLVDGGHVISQSLAIIEYLDEAYPAPALLPRAAHERARVRALALAVACDIHPLNNLRVLNYLRDPLGHDDAAVDGWYAHWIARGLGALEQQVQHTSGDGRHMFGSSVTLADILIVPQMFNARRFKCDTAPYPTLRGICAHLESLAPFAAAAPPAA